MWAKAGCLSMQMTEFCQRAVPVNKNNIHRFGGANKIILKSSKQGVKGFGAKVATRGHIPGLPAACRGCRTRSTGTGGCTGRLAAWRVGSQQLCSGPCSR